MFDLSFKNMNHTKLGFSPRFYKKGNFLGYLICCVFPDAFKWPSLKPYESYLADLNLKYLLQIFFSSWLEILFLHISSSYFYIILPTECILKRCV